MKPVLLLSIVLLVASTAFGQIKFEEGYIVGEDGVRQNCLIRNADWAKSPGSIQYKLSDAAAVQTAGLTSLREFGIGTNYKYIRRTVQVDQSSERASNLSISSEPEFKEETVFLRVWVEGPVSLYQYANSEIRRFFYQRANGSIVPLVYKKFRDDMRVGTNPSFRLQLYDSLRCGDQKIGDNVKVDYTAKDLSKYIIRYNQCKGNQSVYYAGNTSKTDVNFYIRPRLSQTQVDMNFPTFTNTNYKFDPALTFELGFELEVLLPLGKKKWALLAEPGLLMIKQEKDNYRPNQRTSIDYKSIELPVGVRYYSYLTENSRIFLNAHFIPSFPINSTMFFTSTGEVDIKASPNASVGAGAQFLNRYSVELRYHTNRKLSSDNTAWETKISRISLIAGLRLF